MRARLASVLAAAAVTAGCGGGGDVAEEGVDVSVKTFMFEPDPIEVQAGDTVTWTNGDTAVHTVTSGERERPDGEFDEELAESGGTAERTFREAGTYAYFCSLHSGPGMEGTVVVR